MSDLATPRRTHRKGFVAVVLLIVLALVAAMASVAGAAPAPTVPAAGVGTAAAKNSPQCGPDGRLAYPYQQRAPCTRPLKKGESNGGATTMGVTGKTIKVVLLLGNHDQQNTARNQPGGSAPVNHATGQPAFIEESYPDWQTVLSHNFNLWGRQFEFVTVNPTGPDEAAQRADALNVAEKKPFIVVSSAGTAGGGQVFAADLVAKKIIVFGGGITNAEADKQAPYRYLGGFDNNATAINAAQFAARQLKGETAKWSGDFTTKKRVFGLIRPESGIDWQYFTSTAKKEGLTMANGGEVVYSVPLDTSQIAAKNQEEAPVLVAKLKDAGVTTVLMFTSFGMNQQLLKAADSLDYHPEWLFTGLGAQDIEITARILQLQAPEQMKHVFGLGDLPLYVSGIDDPQVNWFNWYWGKNQGVYSAGTVGTLYLLNAGVSLAGPKLTPKNFQQGLFSMPLFGGAASNQVQSFMFAQGPAADLPYDEYSQVGLDYAIMWWNPTLTGKGKILFDEGTGRFMYIDNAKRYKAGEWKKGEPKLFDPSNSISEFNGLPASDTVPDYPCKGCPSTKS
ncbi:MAG: ABC transporter substrate-binding protein [Acidimicrobiia bacterium]